MKKLFIILLACFLLCGCAATPTFEGVEDVYAQDPVPDPRKMRVDIPKEAAAQVIQGDEGRIYLCDGYEFALQTMASGDLDQTMRSLTGFGRSALTMLETSVSEIDRYECAWSAAGEGGDTIARVVVLDDGNYHYCLTVMAPAKNVGALSSQWQALVDSFRLE